MPTMVEGLPVAQEIEVTAKAQRRRFTAAEKLCVLREADRCTKPGELAGLTPRARGPKTKPVDPRDKKIAELERETRRLQARLERAEGLIELQERAAQLLGNPLSSDENA